MFDADRETVFRAQRFERSLHLTSSAVRAWGRLKRSSAVSPGPRLGIVLATDHGDQVALAERIETFGRLIAEGQAAPTDIFRAIAYFPTGRVLRSLAHASGALGPLIPVPANPVHARSIAELLLRAGRADQILLFLGDVTGDPPAPHVNAELLGAPPMPRPDSLPDVVIKASARAAPYGSHHTLAWDAINNLGLLPKGRIVLILATMLGSAGETLFAKVAPTQLEADLVDTARSEAMRRGFAEAFTIVGSSGGAMIGLALAQDLFALRLADYAIICGVDLVGGVLESALKLLRCEDLPGMGGGAMALLLEPSMSGRHSPIPIASRMQLFSPLIASGPKPEVDIRAHDLVALWSTLPDRVAVCGLTEFELEAAKAVATSLWPGCPIDYPTERRTLNCDLLRLVTASERQTGIVSVNAMGGTGALLIC